MTWTTECRIYPSSASCVVRHTVSRCHDNRNVRYKSLAVRRRAESEQFVIWRLSLLRSTNATIYMTALRSRCWYSGSSFMNLSIHSVHAAVNTPYFVDWTSKPTIMTNWWFLYTITLLYCVISGVSGEELTQHGMNAVGGSEWCFGIVTAGSGRGLICFPATAERNQEVFSCTSGPFARMWRVGQERCFVARLFA